MKYFSVPADFKIQTIQKLDELNRRFENAKVIELYGQCTNSIITNSGREINVLPKTSLLQLKEYVHHLEKKGLIFNYTLNPSCMGNFEFSPNGVKKIKMFLVSLYDLGIRHLTLTSPSLFDLVNSINLDFSIKASTICEITTPDKALFYGKRGAKRIVVDCDINRDFNSLKNISESFDGKIEILVNNVCVKNCAYKMFHYNCNAHSTGEDESNVGVDYFYSKCALQKLETISGFIKGNWIRPEDLDYYSEIGIDYFKIQGRQNVINGDLVKTLEHYFKGSYDGNLYELLVLFAPYNSFFPYIDNKKLDSFFSMFYYNHKFCQNTCNKCKYCEKYALKSIDKAYYNEIKMEAEAFYSKFDRYSSFLNGNDISIDLRQLESDFGNI